MAKRSGTWLQPTSSPATCFLRTSASPATAAWSFTITTSAPPGHGLPVPRIARGRRYPDQRGAHPWFYVGPSDIFPEEFINFMGLGGELRDTFLKAHGDLLTARYWQGILKCATVPGNCLIHSLPVLEAGHLAVNIDCDRAMCPVTGPFGEGHETTARTSFPIGTGVDPKYWTARAACICYGPPPLSLGERRIGRPGLVKSWSCTSCAFIPISLHLFPPLRRGPGGRGGGWSRHDQSQGLPDALSFQGPLSQSFPAPHRGVTDMVCD